MMDEVLKVPDTYVGDWDGIPNSWLRDGPAPAAAGLWWNESVNRTLSLSLYLSNT